MGTDIQATAVIGYFIQIDKDDLIRTIKRRGCSHDLLEGAAFCHLCGKDRMVFEESETEADHLETLAAELNVKGLDFYIDRVEENYMLIYVGQSSQSDSHRQGGEPGDLAMSKVDLKAIDKNMRMLRWGVENGEYYRGTNMLVKVNEAIDRGI